jgi:hypothetical protein
MIKFTLSWRHVGTTKGKKQRVFKSVEVQKSDFTDEEGKSNSLRVEGDQNDSFFFNRVGHTVT